MYIGAFLCDNLFMKNIVVQCPAKINLNLKIINKRPDSFHNIESIMQTISLFDYLKIEIYSNDNLEILLSGNSDSIPYDETNLVYKAADIFFKTLKIDNIKVKIHIDKNIPVAAGLAGGSTDAAGTIYGLNKLFNNPLNEKEMHKLCAKLGSDLNVCLKGGTVKSQGRGEIIEQMPFRKFNLSLIKPLNLGISAKEAYTKFSSKEKDEKRKNYLNDLEWAIIDDYKELSLIKNKYPDSMMTGSGSTYFIINGSFEDLDGYWVCNDLVSINEGVKEKL